ncbi:RNA polymerase sigma factor [Lacrimispora sp.]|uniref:RNA polymerase sigma factor n=1 Tax=Lacrimispora sp. TaxID=2719234 RepID=UPI0028B25369|nr:sigma-70 family RNA polymerase sigma factor [Lacrimispora sp.]
MFHVYILQNGLGEYLSFLKEFVYKLMCLMLSSVKMESNKNAIPMQEALRSAQINKQAGRLMESYGNSVLRLAYSYLHNMSDAEDVLQDTLIQFLRTQPQFETTEHEKAWFLRVAINISKNKITYNKIRKTDELSETLAVAETEDLAFVWDAVKQLPAKYSEVVHLYYHEGYSTAQIASLLSKNDATVRSLLQRARMKLKDVLKEVYDFEE